jgi:hypothetical protein
MAARGRSVDPRYVASSGGSWALEQWTRDWHAGRVGPRRRTSDVAAPTAPTPEVRSPLELEQAYLDESYRLVQQMLDQSRGLDLDRLDASIRAAARRGAAERIELLERLLERDEHLPLLLGRLDSDDRALYVGRAMVVDEEREVKIASWRAPAAAAFYRASRQAPDGVLRRRRIHTSGRRVTEVADEALVDPLPHRLQTDLAEQPDRDPVAEALAQRRGSRMVDVVSTLMPDQYELVAAPRQTSLVVQGAPGSGKTAVGLHRAAFLLYGEDAAQGLAPTDVLIVGPNPTFLDYIHDVLPDLGEHDIHQTTLHGLLATRAIRPEPSPEREELLGQERMATLVDQYVWSLPTRPSGDIRVGRVLLSTPRLQDAFDAAMRQHGGFADRREAFITAAIRTHPDEPEPGALRASLSRRFWPALRPEAAVSGLLENAAALVGPHLGTDEAALLARVQPGEWTRAETVLIDEAEACLHGRVQERYAHLVVDEVQDLTAMELRVLRRRAGAGASFTLLGDLAQATRTAAPADWREIRRLLVPGGEVERVDLPTAYRVPASALDPALALFEQLEVDVAPPVAYRREGQGVTVHYAGTGAELAESLVIAVLLAADRGGSVGVVAPAEGVEEVRALLVEHELLDQHQTLGAALSVVADRDVHGLEFDHVVVVEPAWIVADDGARGLRRLYVALTRCTQSLTLLHHDGLPASLASWAAQLETPARAPAAE